MKKKKNNYETSNNSVNHNNIYKCNIDKGDFNLKNIQFDNTTERIKILNLLKELGIDEDTYENKIMLLDDYLIGSDYGEKIGDIQYEVRKYKDTYIVTVGRFMQDDTWYTYFGDNRRTAYHWLAKKRKSMEKEDKDKK